MNAQTDKIDIAQIRRKAILTFFAALIVLSAMFFISAGTFDFWQAWVYLAIILGTMLYIASYLIKYAPDLMARRMKFIEREKEQSLIIKLSYIPFVFAYILPGFDRRFGWSDMPVWVAILGNVLVFAGYWLVFNVFKQNAYASRVIETSEVQQVISTGLYGFVRHPMYLGNCIMYILSPIALGSWWAVIPALLIVPVIVMRIRNEEKVLAKDLPGYSEYLQKVKYRLVPGVW